MLCPVCLTLIQPDRDGLVPAHEDEVGSACPMSGRDAPAWDQQSTHEAVESRSGGICEYCRKRRAHDMHHRKSRGVGGRWHPANVIHLCRTCHRFVTEHPGWAHALGLIVKSTENPSKRPVTREDASWFQPSDDIAMPLPRGRK